MDRTTEMLSAYSCGLTYEELGPAVVDQVKRTLVDTMGCAIGGFDSEPAAIARSMVDGVSGGMPSRVLGTSGSTMPDLAAFANGVAVRYLDCNDSYFSPGGGHPSDMISAVLAMADPLKSDGPAVISAIALAYEVFCRLSDEVVASDLGWDQGIFSVIGAVCGAARVMGLDEEQTGNAISLSINTASAVGGYPYRGAGDVEGVRRSQRLAVSGVRGATGGEGNVWSRGSHSRGVAVFGNRLWVERCPCPTSRWETHGAKTMHSGSPGPSSRPTRRRFTRRRPSASPCNSGRKFRWRA